jgi:superfamily II DNA or RNA helicase
MFGPVHNIVTAKNLIDAGQAVPIDIRIMLLKHPEIFRKAYKGMDYAEEVKYLVANQARNMFIARLIVATKGNSLGLFSFVESHGKVLYEMVKALVPEGRNVYFISGEVKYSERERIRKIVETETDAIILATSSLMSTGTNIPSISNLIMIMPGKSNIRIRQTIGRGLRLKEGKDRCIVFDIADDMTYKNFKNTAWHHMEARVGIYTKESFNWKVNKIDLEQFTETVKF